MNRPPSTTASRRFGRFALLLIIVAASVYAGAHYPSLAPKLGLSAADPAQSQAGTQAGMKQLWTCGMHPQVIQDHPGDCPICHMKLTPMKMATGDASGGMGHDHGAMTMNNAADQGKERKIKYWWDPMLNPPYISDKPGKSPMGMDLIPVFEGDEANAKGGVTIDPTVVQNMGVRTALVSEGVLKRSIRLTGSLEEAQPNIHDINIRVSGWVRRLHANNEGMHIAAGDPLFDLYSPELQVAIEELIASRRAQGTANNDTASVSRTTANTLYDATTRKLELLGLSPSQVEAFAKLNHAPESITFTSPISGDVTEKPIVEGAAVKAGDRVLRIVDHSTLWLEAQIFEKDLPSVKVGADVTATIASQPGDAIRGTILLVQPHVDIQTRTAIARVEISNSSLSLRPGMFASVQVAAEPAAHAIMVPREAVIDSGESQLVFVARSVGHFEPRRVKMGLSGDGGVVQIAEGLTPGEIVVTSGQFLLDSESRLRETIQKFLSERRARTSGTPSAITAQANSVPGMFVDQQVKLDAVIAAYLDLADRLGQEHPPSEPVDSLTLVSAARALRGGMKADDPVATSIVQAADDLRGKSLEQQRDGFNALSANVLALLDAHPPSRALGEHLYVMYCPMVKKSWVQRGEEIANPFDPEMHSCGSLLRTINTSEGAHP